MRASLAELLGLDPDRVNVKGKTKRFQQKSGRRSDWKKAYVKLAEGSSVEEFFGAD